MQKLQPKLWTPAARIQVKATTPSCEAEPAVWLVSPETSALAELDVNLTPEELARKSRFRNSKDRWRFSAGRSVLRRMLGHHLRIAPQEVKIACGPYGKPFLPTQPGFAEIHFNVAHSGDLVLVAFHRSREVGVDVEKITDQHDWNDVAQQLFSAEQYRAWTLLDSGQRQLEFFRAWTRREASLKAIGTGLVAALPSGRETQLALADLDLPRGYVGAVGMVREHQ